MRRVLLFALAALVLWIGGRAIVRALASDSTKIRRVIEAMADGFDRTRMDPILAGLAKDFADETSGASREDVREGLAYLFLTAKDETTKGFPYRVTLEIRRIDVVGESAGPRTATCSIGARFRDLRGGADAPTWEIELSADLVRGDDGWRIRRSKYETKSGRMLR